MSTQDTEAAYENPATGETFSESDAQAAGWIVVHNAVDAETEGVTLNATHWFAEKYVSPPGRPGGYVTLVGHTKEGLLAAIQMRESQFATSEEGTVLLPAEGFASEDVDTSENDTVQRVSDADVTAARDNDVLTVLSDPEDPDSDVVRKTVVGGREVDESELSEPTPEPTATIAAVQEGNQAAIDKAVELRDQADTVEDADGPDAASQVAQADYERQQAVFDNESPALAGGSGAGSPGDSGNDPEVVQPEAGTATDASDSEEQGQVPDSEAASSDAGLTNSTDAFPQVNESQPEVLGPDTDAEAPAPAPNASDSTE